MARSWDYDLADSLVASDAGADVGLCMLAGRDAEAWIGGVGVVAGRRGEGIGEQLMRAVEDRARDRRVDRIWLEVLVQNEPAIRLYEKLNYAHVRDLEVWSLDEGLVFQKHKVPSVPLAEAIGRSEDRLPWQRADASAAKLADAHALADARGSLVYRTSNGIASIVQLTARRRGRNPRPPGLAPGRDHRRPLRERARGRPGERSPRGARRHANRPPARAGARALVEADHAADAVLRLHQLEAAVHLVEREPVRDERVDVDVARR